ncbi:hypothetical protein AQBE111736_14055 [Aquirufa beregesia]
MFKILLLNGQPISGIDIYYKVNVIHAFTQIHL